MTELEKYRSQIDEINNSLTTLFVKRMAISAEIADFKKANGLPISDKNRENEIIKAQLKTVPDDLKDYAERFYRNLFLLSREYQEVKNG